MSFNLNSIKISGKEVLPVIEGGKGIGVSSGVSSGAFAAANAVGTFSGANAESYDENNEKKQIVYHGKTRRERHEELVAAGIEGGIAQAKIAHDISGGKGPIHMNILWEMGGAQRILEGILEGAKGLIHGITCGAGMPYKLSEISARYNVYYYPIVSSMRAFRALWKRSYKDFSSLLGGVVYEDPWKAGGHNGLSNSEDPEVFQDPYQRVVELRKFMNEVNLQEVPIIMAGGVWHIKEWEHWLNNKEIGKIAFQFGTRPIITKESPVLDEWKQKLMTLKEGDVFLNRFSPTGFYSSAVKNNFIQELDDRSKRQIPYAMKEDSEKGMVIGIPFGQRGRLIYITKDDALKAEGWKNKGFTELMKTPDSTVIFVTPEKANAITKDQIDCMGCLSACKFSNWRDKEDFNTGRKADPRSFCIQKTLTHIVREGDVDNQLMFSGHNAYRFATDPFYANGFIPTVKELVDRIITGY
ncbi:MAG: nitronate monooxygenase [Alphaproteobacteria bacterium]|nr:nitronate monooxygenase [Alphaproteobacteria bacterium]